MNNNTFTPALAGQTFHYKETRFAPISKDDNYCYRCQREILDLFDLYSEKPSNQRPYPTPQNDHEREENQKWFQQNMGRHNEEVLRWSDTAGYYSNGLDGMRMCLVLCEDCKLELLGPFMKFKDAMYGPQQHHRKRWEQRNDQDVQNRWDARKQKRILNSTISSSIQTPVARKI